MKKLFFISLVPHAGALKQRLDKTPLGLKSKKSVAGPIDL